MKSLSKILFVYLMLMSSSTKALAIDCEVANPFPIKIILPTTIILDTISGSRLNFNDWIIQLNPDPFLDGIRIRSTQKEISFGWSLKNLDGEELGSKVKNHREAKLDCRFLPKGTYVLELRTLTETSSVKLVKY